MDYMRLKASRKMNTLRYSLMLRMGTEFTIPKAFF